MQAQQELNEVASIGRYILQVAPTRAAGATPPSVPHTGGDEPPCGDPAASFIATHWTRVIYFDLFSGHMGAGAELDAAPTPPPPAVAAPSARVTSAPSSMRRATPSVAVVGILLVAYLVAAIAIRVAALDANAAATGRGTPAAVSAPHAFGGSPFGYPGALTGSRERRDPAPDCARRSPADAGCIDA